LAGAGTSDDSVEQQTWTGEAHQRWTVTDRGGVYSIVNVNSGKALDVAGISTENGANVHQWADVGGDNQHWQLDEV
jgi:hypothetical protein